MRKYWAAISSVFLLLSCEEQDSPDYSPDRYELGGIENAQVETFYFSDTITVTGISHPTSIQLDAITYGEEYIGEIYINGSQVTVGASSEVMPGDEIYVKVQSSQLHATSVTATITIGDQKDDFTVTTQPLPLQATNYPGKFFYDLKAFAIDDNVYMGLGGNWEDNVEVKELYEFNISEGSWVQKAGYQGDTDFSYYFSVAGKGYMGYENAIVEYDPTADSWKRVENISLGEGITSKSVFEVNEEIFALVDYANVTSKIWRFDASNISWVLLKEVDNTHEDKHFLFVLENQAYFKVGDAAELWSYDVLTHTWADKTTLPEPEPGLGLSYNGKGFILYRNIDGITIYQYEHQADEFSKVTNIYSFGEQNPPDAMLMSVTTDQHAFIMTAHYSGVLGDTDLAKFVIYEVRRL